MQLRLEAPSRRQLIIGGAVLGAGALAFAFRGLLAQVGTLALGAGVLCFVAAPLARLYEGKLSRPIAALAALLTIAAAVCGLLWLLLPPIYRQLTSLIQTLPDSVARLADWGQAAPSGSSSAFPALRCPSSTPRGCWVPCRGSPAGRSALRSTWPTGSGRLR